MEKKKFTDVLYIGHDQGRYHARNIKMTQLNEGDANPVFQISYTHQGGFSLVRIMRENHVETECVTSLEQLIKSVLKHAKSKLIEYEITVDYPLNMLRLYWFALYVSFEGCIVVDIDKDHFPIISELGMRIFILEYQSLKPNLYKSVSKALDHFSLDFCQNRILGTLSHSIIENIILTAQALGAKVIEQ
jgi:hypothetical protein